MIDLRSRRPWESDEAAMFRTALRRFLEDEAVPREETWRRSASVDSCERFTTGHLRQRRDQPVPCLPQGD